MAVHVVAALAVGLCAGFRLSPRVIPVLYKAVTNDKAKAGRIER